MQADFSLACQCGFWNKFEKMIIFLYSIVKATEEEKAILPIHFPTQTEL